MSGRWHSNAEVTEESQDTHMFKDTGAAEVGGPGGQGRGGAGACVCGGRGGGGDGLGTKRGGSQRPVHQGSSSGLSKGPGSHCEV